jgi:hypothetical protein
VTLPRAADDFTAIRARMLQLERERAQAILEQAADSMARAYRRLLGRDSYTADAQEQQPGPFRDRRRFTP